MRQNKIAVDTWARMDTMADALDGTDKHRSSSSASAQMKYFIDTHKVYTGMRLSNETGLVIASSHPKNINTVNVATREYFQASMKGNQFVSQALLSKTSGKPILVISSPVQRSGKILGVLYSVIDLGGFTAAQLDTIKVGDTGYVFMMNPEGQLLAYPPETSQIMKLDLSDFEFGKKILDMKNGLYKYTYKDVEKITAFNEVEQTGWIVVATVPAEEVFAEAMKIHNLLVIIGVIVTAALCGGIIILVALFIIRPIKAVVVSPKDIAQGEGDLTKHLPVNSQNELGELALGSIRF